MKLADEDATLRVLVAPYVSAWIETLCLRHASNDNKVAPYVGAWIETAKLLGLGQKVLSHPTWVRGLKLVIE